MSKIVLHNVLSGFNLAKINENFQEIKDTLNEKVLYRDNPLGEANTMENILDMNGYDIINVKSISGDLGNTPASVIPFTPYLDIAATNVQDAVEEVKDDVEAVEAKLSQIVSVTDFGAKCDGVTDDWAAIQAAQEYLKANGGGTLYFPGWCLINQPFYFYGSINNGWIANPAYPNPNQAQITWRSDTQGGIRAGSMTSGDLLRFSNPNTSTALLYTVGFKDFVIDCVQKNITAINGQAYEGAAGSGDGANHYIDINGLVIQGIEGANAIGLDLGTITDSKVIACHVQGWGSGPYAGIRVNKTDVQLIDCRMSYCRKGIVVGKQAEACIQMFGGAVQSPKEHIFYWESATADTKSSASVITGAFLGETQDTAYSAFGPLMGAASPSNLDICTITFVGCVFDNWTTSPFFADITWGGNFTFIGCSAWTPSTGSKSIKFGQFCNVTWVNNRTISVSSAGEAVALGKVKEPVTYAQNVSYIPTFAATGSTFSYADNGQKGYYTKVGNTVTVTARMQLAASGNTLTANQLSLSLPLASANNTFQEPVCTVGVYGATSSLFGAMGIIPVGSQRIDLYKTAAAQANFYGTPLLANDLSGVSGASGVQVTATYFTPY